MSAKIPTENHNIHKIDQTQICFTNKQSPEMKFNFEER
jgi:hypothetical protein